MEASKHTAGKCPECGTPMHVAGGIGDYCPNRACEFLDGYPATVVVAPTIKAVLLEALSEQSRVLGFFASVIKSGEPWTATCAAEYEAARAKTQAAISKATENT